jgi:hypothetical protein
MQLKFFLVATNAKDVPWVFCRFMSFRTPVWPIKAGMAANLCHSFAAAQQVFIFTNSLAQSALAALAVRIRSEIDCC